MPIYEYQCNKCGHRFEAIQKVSDAPLKRCEKCKGKVERIVSSPAIQFKGSGWYVTDYARKSGGPESSKSESSKSDSDSGKSASAKSESSSKKSDDSTKKSDKTNSTK